jgi:hypothetical protein
MTESAHVSLEILERSDIAFPGFCARFWKRLSIILMLFYERDLPADFLVLHCVHTSMRELISQPIISSGRGKVTTAVQPVLEPARFFAEAFLWVRFLTNDNKAPLQ